jgi:hypothetical protein
MYTEYPNCLLVCHDDQEEIENSAVLYCLHLGLEPMNIKFPKNTGFKLDNLNTSY